MRTLLEAGHAHIVDADLENHFDTIRKDRLQALVALVGGKVADGRILALVERRRSITRAEGLLCRARAVQLASGGSGSV